MSSAGFWRNANLQELVASDEVGRGVRAIPDPVLMPLDQMIVCLHLLFVLVEGGSDQLVRVGVPRDQAVTSSHDVVYENARAG